MMKTENWINGMTVYFYGNDIDKWERNDIDKWVKICKDAEEGKVPKITIRGIEYELVRHGKWIIHECFDFKDMTCSSCGWLYEYYAGLEEEWEHCPHCGAKMDDDEISNIAKESADKISKALEKVRAKGMQKQNIKEDDEP